MAAAVVFVYHLGHWGVWAPVGVFDLGYVGVGFFFVLSGFVLTVSVVPGTSPHTFFWRRFARIYPSHLVFTLVALFVLVPVAKDARSFVASAFLVQSWSLDPSVVYGMNGVAWSLSCEVAFYAAFPLTIVMLRRWSARTRWAVGVAWFLGTSAFVWSVAAGQRSETWELVASVNPVVRFSEFLLGVIAAMALREGWRPSVSLWHAGLVLGLLIAVTRVVEAPYPLPNQLLAPAFLIVILAATRADLDGGRGVLTRRWFIRAGEASYAFYLVHELVIINLRSWLGLDGSLMAAIALAGSVVAALALHRLVERPCQARLRARFAGSVVDRTAVVQS